MTSIGSEYHDIAELDHYILDSHCGSRKCDNERTLLLIAMGSPENLQDSPWAHGIKTHARMLAQWQDILIATRIHTHTYIRAIRNGAVVAHNSRRAIRESSP